MHEKRYRLIPGCLLLALSLSWPPAAADDSDIFLLDTVPPNVMILLDSSGSMGREIDGALKMDVAKQVVTNLIQNVQGVRIGVFRFDDGQGLLVAAVGTDADTMVRQVNAIVPNGGTPLGTATQAVQNYLAGEYADAEAYPSPIEYECQKSYAILVTDGLPNGEPEGLVASVATSLFTTDHSETLPGMQNVIVHTVGFDIPDGAELLTETATNGGGNFYTANSAASLERAIGDALSSIVAASYTFAQPLVPSTSAAGGGLAYFGSFEPEPSRPFWRGRLEAFTRAANGAVPTGADGKVLASALAWDAGAGLAGRASASRTIYTSVDGARASFVKGTASITASLLDVPAGTRDALIDFVRGIDAFDEDSDGNTTEDRAWKLGDIFHSAPVLVFPPPLSSTDPDYATFRGAHADRPAIVLVGANDGMLHAFRTSDGHELWGFIPPNLLPELQTLAGGFDHPYYVDGSPVVADVKLDGVWKTIAVFGERRGGRYYHALDITDVADPVYLWSFTDSEMGETWSMPTLGRVKLADGTARHVAFVGGGYDTGDNNAAGRGLFVIDLASGSALWRYTAGASGDATRMNFSVPGRPNAADLDRDGYTDRVYVGDVGGQLWKFDISAPATLTGGLVSNWTGKRVFAAAPAAANPPATGEFHAPQAIYGAPALAYDELGDLWVFFGTGDRNHPKDASTNSMFGLKDDTTMANGTALTAAALVDVASGSAPSQGWYFELGANEKVLGSADVFNKVVYFTTYQPVAAEPCDAQRGTARLYGLRMNSGAPTVNWPGGDVVDEPDGSEPESTVIGGGIPSDPDIDVDATNDVINVGTTDQEVDEVRMPPTRRKRIRYWREVM